jgi:hypothetical protein
MKKGDKIEVLDDAISGVITGIEGDMVTFETADGFEMTYPAKELVLMSGTLSKKELFSGDVKAILSEKNTEKRKRITRIKPKERNLPPMEVDLHIHKLVQEHKKLSNYDILTIQMDTAKRQLEFAIGKKIPKIVFIHGVGDGVLRAELEYLFRQYENMKYYDADFQKYGRGATEVYIFQSKSP